MPLRAHVNQPESSIARILLPALWILSSSAGFAAEPDTNPADPNPVLTKTLPKLENTNNMDRFLSREVKDSYIFGTPPATSSDSDQVPNNSGAAAENREKNVVTVPERNPLKTTTASTVAPDALPIEQPVLSTATQPVAPQKNNQKPVLPDSWQQVDKDDPSVIKSVWEHIIDADRLPLAAHERVKFYEDQYRRESLWISKILDRGTPFLAHLVSALDQRFMPIELALLPAIESGYRTTAKSTGNAAGLWQIVPITAKEIGVQRTTWFDGRGDVLKSTTAAIDYLSYLNSTFDGDWELTLAAYNAGPGRVKAAMRKNTAAGLPTDYWSLNLPRETMNYVPKLIALVRLIKLPDHGGLTMPSVPMEPAFESIDVGFRVSLDKVAKMTNIDESQLRTLNAGLIHGVTAPDGPHHLLIPAGTGQRFQQAFANVDRNRAFSEPKIHAVIAGDTVSSVALKYGLSQRALIAMNGLDNANIRIGQKLAVLDSRNASESVVEYVVTIGDTLSEIADKFSVNVKDIKLSTGEALDGDIIHPGTTLNIIVDMPSSG